MDRSNKYIPYHKVYLETNLSIDEISQVLKDNVQKGSMGEFFSGLDLSKKYRGNVIGNGFEIHRNNTYQNSFRFYAIGSVRKKKDKTRIELAIQFHPVVMIFISLLFIGLFMLFIASIVLSLTQAIKPFFILIATLPIFGFFLLMRHAFYPESLKFLNELKALFLPSKTPS